MSEVSRFNFYARTESVAVGPGSDGLDAKPMGGMSALIAEQDGRTIQDADQQIQFALVKKICGCRSPTHVTASERGAGMLADLIELAISQVMKEKRPLRISYTEGVLIHLRIDMAISDENVGPTIVISVEEFQTESEKRDTDWAETGRAGKIGEFAVPIIVK